MIRPMLTAAALIAIMHSQSASAHSSSTAYLRAGNDHGHLELQWRVALRDLDALLDLDRNGDGHLTWGEVDDRRQELEALMQSAIVVTDATARSCPLAPPELRYVALGGAGYAELTTRVDCSASSPTIDYRMFVGVDPSHRLLAITGATAVPQLIAPGQRWQIPSGASTPGQPLTHYVADGFSHILGGLDHLLFLIGLMLPAVVRRDSHGSWHARNDVRSALLGVVGIATSFTLAHSLTLAAATFGWIRVPAAIIEPLIAATVLATALNNLIPLVTRRLWIAAFTFGLIHGFGFAEVLAPLDLPPRELALALLGFNLGVELGQLLVVAVSFSLLALARHSPGYVRYALRGGSVALAVVAVVWIVERLSVSPLPT